VAKALDRAGIDFVAWRSESAGSESKSQGDHATLFEKEATIATAFEDGTLKGEDNPHVVQAWPTFRDGAAPRNFPVPTEFDREKPPARRTGIYGAFYNNVSCETVVFLTTLSADEIQTDVNGEPWPLWYTEHLKVAAWKKAQKVKEGAMQESQKFIFLLGINTEEGLPKVSSCANTEIGKADDGRRLSPEQLEKFHEMWRSVYCDA